MMNCILAGVGGQGTVLASKLLAQTAMDLGHVVHTAETIGMAQRGGGVVSHLRIGEGLRSPLIPAGQADVLIGFEPAEAVRNIAFLKPGGRLVVNTRAIVPFTSSLSGTPYHPAEMLGYLSAWEGLLCIDAGALAREAGSDKAVNVALLGAAVQSGVFPFAMEAMERTLQTMLPQRLHDVNLAALRLGARQAEEGGVTPCA